MKMKAKEKKAYKDFQDRVAMLGKPRKLTEEEIKKLKKEGRIQYHQSEMAGGIFIPVFKKERTRK